MGKKVKKSSEYKIHNTPPSRKAFKYKVSNMNATTEKNLMSILESCRQLYNGIITYKDYLFVRGSYETECKIEDEKKLINGKIQVVPVPKRKRKWSPSLTPEELRHFKMERFSVSAEIKPLRKELKEYNHINSELLHSVVHTVCKAFDTFIKLGGGHPKYKGKKFYNTLIFQKSGWKLVDNVLYLTNTGREEDFIGKIKLFMDRPTQGTIKTVTIKKESSGHWFVVFTCENVPHESLNCRSTETIGIDTGLKTFATLSNGEFINQPKFFKDMSLQLERLDRKISKCNKNSKRQQKLYIQRNKLWDHIVNTRRNWQFNLSKQLWTNYKSIVIGELKPKQLSNKKRRLGKSFADAAHYQFKTILTNKGAEYNRTCIEVNERHTTQTCYKCGNIKTSEEKLDLNDRTYVCDECGNIDDRDVNAAKNIRQRGLDILNKV